MRLRGKNEKNVRRSSRRISHGVSIRFLKIITVFIIIPDVKWIDKILSRLARKQILQKIQIVELYFAEHRETVIEMKISDDRCL